MSGSDRNGVDALLAGTACALVPRDVIEASGPDTVRFLQSLLSQSVDDLAVGGARWSFLLEPQGKVVALFRVVRTADEAFTLDTDPGVGATLRDALLRYRIRTKCDLSEPVPAELSASPSADGVPTFGDGAGLVRTGLDDWEVARIVAGIPRHGSEIGPDTIPNATGLVPVATARKGCYVGQELVERIDSRGGNVPERLVVLEGAAAGVSDGAVVLGEPIVVRLPGDDAVVGRITSIAVHRGAWHAIGWVRRSAPIESELVGEREGAALRLRVCRDVGPV